MGILSNALNLNHYDHNGMYDLVEIERYDTTIARVLNRTTINGVLSPTNAGSFVMSYHYIPVKPLVSDSTDGYSDLSSGKLKIGDTPIETTFAGGEPKTTLGGFIKRFKYVSLGQIYYNVESFLDLEPYTQLKLYLPFLGYVELNPNDVINKYIQIRMLVDFSTGDTTYFVATSTAPISGPRDDDNLIERIIYTDTCNIAYHIPINATNANEVARNTIVSALKTAITYGAYKYVGAPDPSAVTAKKTITKRPFTKTYSVKNPNTNRFVGKYKMATSERVEDWEYKHNTERDVREYKARNISSIMSDSLDTLNRAYSAAKTEGVKGINSLIVASTDVYLFKIKPRVVQQASEFEHLYGKPLGQTITLGALNGYTEIADVHLSSTDFNEATQEEMAMLKEELLGGIYLP